MKLNEIIADLMESDLSDISQQEIVDTIKYLIQDSICTDRDTLLKIGRIVKSEVDYERG